MSSYRDYFWPGTQRCRTDTRATETKATGKTNPLIHHITIVLNFVLIVIYDPLHQFHQAHVMLIKFTNAAEAPVTLTKWLEEHL